MFKTILLGTVTISESITYDSDLLTLACISTGGPATTVTWTRDSITVTEGTETVLDDPVTAQYTHTLTVTTGGEYTCTVYNNEPSSDSATITVPGRIFVCDRLCKLHSLYLPSIGPLAPNDVAAVQDGPTSIRVSWTPSSDAAGYRIHYTGSNSYQNTLNILGQSINSYTLTGLENGETYTVHIMTKSLQSLLGSPVVAGNVGLGTSIVSTVIATPTIILSTSTVPSAPILSWRTLTTSTSITISDTVPSDSVVTGFLVECQRDTSVGCSDRDGFVTSLFTLTGLQPGNRYIITARASNTAGLSPVSNSVTAMTNETSDWK